MCEQRAEVVAGGPVPGRSGPYLVVRQTGDRLDGLAVPVVGAVDAQHLEPGRERLDLAEEVLGREPALAQRLGQRVRGRRERHPGVADLAQQPGHQHRVARVVELELVDADQPHAGQRPDGRGEPERTDQVGVLHEGAVHDAVGRPRAHAVRKGREQVRLAHPEPAVQVHRRRPRGAPPQACQAPRRWHGQPGRERHQPLARRRLARVRAIRAVGLEGRRVEVPRHHEAREELPGRKVRAAQQTAHAVTSTTSGERGSPSTAATAAATSRRSTVRSGSRLRPSSATAAPTATSWKRTR